MKQDARLTLQFVAGTSRRISCPLTNDVTYEGTVEHVDVERQMVTMVIEHCYRPERRTFRFADVKGPISVEPITTPAAKVHPESYPLNSADSFGELFDRACAR